MGAPGREARLTSAALVATAHRQLGTVSAHWRANVDAVARMLPPGVRPDVVDGSAWVGLVAYRFGATAAFGRVPLGVFGRMTEVAVELLTVDDAGRHGVTYRSVEAQSVPAVAAARIGLGVPYRFARTGSRIRTGAIDSDRFAHRSRRRGAVTEVDVDVAAGATAGMVSPLDRALAERDGIVARHLGRTTFWTRTTTPLALRTAVARRISAPGLPGRAPDSLVVADAHTVEYSWGGVIR